MQNRSGLSNAFRAIIIIHKKGKVTNEELANELNVSKKQITRYIKAMKQAGIDVKSKCGPSGGYTLDECPFCSKIL